MLQCGARITARGLEFQFYGQALQAAVDGLGVAMGIRPYIDDDLAAGRAPLSPIIDMTRSPLGCMMLAIPSVGFS